jgi:hypothetical protein
MAGLMLRWAGDDRRAEAPVIPEIDIWRCAPVMIMSEHDR